MRHTKSQFFLNVSHLVFVQSVEVKGLVENEDVVAYGQPFGFVNVYSHIYYCAAFATF